MSEPQQSGEPSASGHWLNRTVFGAGLTSALGDLTYETSNVILPGFLAVLGLPPAALGAAEGIADGVSSVTKLASGYIADRLGARKFLVLAGYGLTALMQVFLALASGWWLILLGRIVGWFGRGIRGPLRDAILSEAITPSSRGKAFGFHRAADTVGAVAGPLLGVALLGWAQALPFADSTGPFRLVIWFTLIPGVAAVLCFWALVRDDRTAPNPHVALSAAWRSMSPPFRRFLAAAGLFGLGDFSHLLLILGASELLTPRHGALEAAQIAGLLYVGRNLVQAIASYPVGALADRIGPRPVLVVGYLTGSLVAGLLIVAFAWRIDSIVFLGGIFFLAGFYIATQEALEAVMAADLLPGDIRGLGYGVLGSVNGVGDLFSSTCLGLIWTLVSPVAGFGVMAVFMFGGAVMMARCR